MRDKNCLVLPVASLAPLAPLTSSTEVPLAMEWHTLIWFVDRPPRDTMSASLRTLRIEAHDTPVHARGRTSWFGLATQLLPNSPTHDPTCDDASPLCDLRTQ